MIALLLLLNLLACRTYAPVDLSGPPQPDGGDTGLPMAWIPAEACGLEHDPVSPYWTEGDTLSFSVRCRNPEADRSRVRVVGAGDRAVWDAETGRFTWVTDGRDGGRIDLVLTAPADTEGALPETLPLTVWVADNPDAPNPRVPAPLVYTEEWGLPVVHIEVDGGVRLEDRPARFTVRDQQVTGEIKYRGATSSAYPKRSYTLDFDSDELSVEEWEGPSRGHMVLISTFDDNSYVRQKLSYDLWAAMGVHLGKPRLAPRTFFAVVYLNGSYLGLYTGCDRIDNEFLRHMGFDGEGSLYKAVDPDANFKLTDADGNPKEDLGQGYEKKQPDDEDWTDIEALVAFTGSADAETFRREGGSLLDREDFIDWLILSTYALSEDSVSKNAYLHADAAGLPFKVMPWDFNHSWGQAWNTKRRAVDRLPDYRDANQIFALLLADEEGRAEVAARYASLRDDGPLQEGWLEARLDAYYAQLGPSVARDWAHWGADYRAFERWLALRDSADDWTDAEGEEAYLYNWVRERPTHMDGWLP